MPDKLKFERKEPEIRPGPKMTQRRYGERVRKSTTALKTMEADPKDLPLSFSSGRTRSVVQTSDDVKQMLDPSKRRMRSSRGFAPKSVQTNSPVSDSAPKPVQNQNKVANRFHEYSRKMENLAENKEDLQEPAKPSEALKRRQKRTIYEQSQHRPGKLQFEQKPTEQAIHTVGNAVSRSIAGDVKADENVSVQAGERSVQTADKGVRAATRSIKQTKNRTHARNTGRIESSPVQQKLRPGDPVPSSPEIKKGNLNHMQQKRRIRRNYAKGYRVAQKGGSSAVKGAAAPRPTLVNRMKNFVTSIPRKSKGALVALGSLGMFSMIIVSVLGAGGAAASETEGAIAATTYMAEDEDILAAQDTYLDLEAQLQAQIDNIEIDYPDYDEYEYQIDEISHNPYHLISFLTVMFGEFRHADVVNSIQGLFEKQYTLTLEEESETVTETRTIKAGESLGDVVTSGYCACEICCGKWAGGPTASGEYPKADHTIAVDADNPFVPMGTHVIMNGKEYVVEDTGAFDQYGVQFDVFYDDHQEALNHGHKTWEAKLADDNGSEEVEITETKKIDRLKVKVTNNKLDLIIRELLDDDQIDEYDTYNSCFGNKEYLFGTENLPGEGGIEGIKYDIPPEALKDKQFKAMITEAEKYLGMAYKWGGKSPDKGFDCSGFVSWVINHCGVGWNYGSMGAQALCGICTYVSPSEAKPGDLVFFERTYDTEGVSHVGLYVGENIMIHCGDPIQYTNLNYQYWQDHFLCFGRLPEP